MCQVNLLSWNHGCNAENAGLNVLAAMIMKRYRDGRTILHYL
jgi:hypothetical protein